MKKHHRQLGQGASWVKFRRRMFVALNQLNLLPSEQKEEVTKLQQDGTRYRLPEIARPKRQSVVTISRPHVPTHQTSSPTLQRDLRW